MHTQVHRPAERRYLDPDRPSPSDPSSSSPPPPRPTTPPPPASPPPTPPPTEATSSRRLDSLLSLGPVLFDPVRPPRHPIVLAHGLYGFSVRSFPSLSLPFASKSLSLNFQLHYWGQVLSILRDRIGAKVVVGSVPPTGSIKDRAWALHRMLEAEDGIRGREVNVLAHSMGGLDARYLLTHIRPDSYTPTSLTTLCTPHRGSPFMAWCQANIGLASDVRHDLESLASPYPPTSPPAPAVAEAAAKARLPFSLKEPILSRPNRPSVSPPLSKPPQTTTSSPSSSSDDPSEAKTTLNLSSYLLSLLDSPAYSNLLPSYLENHFNPRTPDVEGVRYWSVGARSGRLGVWHPLWLPKLILDAHETRLSRPSSSSEPEGKGRPREKGNDGLVEVESAKWGEFLGTVEGADHWDIRGSSSFLNPKTKTLVAAAASRTSTSTSTSSSPSSSTTGLDGSGEGKDGKSKEAAGRAGNGGQRWGWQEVNALVGKLVGRRAAASPLAAERAATSTVKGGGAEVEAAASPTSTTPDPSSSPTTAATAGPEPAARPPTTALVARPDPDAEADGPTDRNLRALAEKITTLIPPTSSLALSAGSAASSTSAGPAAASATTETTARSAAGPAESPLAPVATSYEARMLHGATSSTSSRSSASSSDSGAGDRAGQGSTTVGTRAGKKEPFSLHRFYAALCRNMYEAGM